MGSFNIGDIVRVKGYYNGLKTWSVIKRSHFNKIFVIKDISLSTERGRIFAESRKRLGGGHLYLLDLDGHKGWAAEHKLELVYTT